MSIFVATSSEKRYTLIMFETMLLLMVAFPVMQALRVVSRGFFAERKACEWKGGEYALVAPKRQAPARKKDLLVRHSEREVDSSLRCIRSARHFAAQDELAARLESLELASIRRWAKNAAKTWKARNTRSAKKVEISLAA
jgi:hypothetical protein